MDIIPLPLQTLLNFSEKQSKRVKAKFNITEKGTNPKDLYLADKEKMNTEWLFWRAEQRYYKVGETAMCFIKMGDYTWLLTTIKKITKELKVTNGINYEGEELAEYAPYYGRVIVRFRKRRGQVYSYNTIRDELIVTQILPSPFNGEEFPGYENVRLSFERLETIVNQGNWEGELKNRKAVYLITDKESGKMYVGSATSSNGMLLSRWSEYVSNGHGGNIELKKLVDERGFEYIKKNFVYSILENYNANIDDDVILKRENWWKDTLLTRTFGYNKN